MTAVPILNANNIYRQLEGSRLCRRLERHYVTHRSWYWADSIVSVREMYTTPLVGDCDREGTWDNGMIKYEWGDDAESTVVTITNVEVPLYRSGNSIVLAGYPTSGCVLASGRCKTNRGVLTWPAPSDNCGFDLVHCGNCSLAGSSLVIKSKRLGFEVLNASRDICGTPMNATREGLFIKWDLSSGYAVKYLASAVEAEHYESIVIADMVHEDEVALVKEQCAIRESIGNMISYMPTVGTYIKGVDGMVVLLPQQTQVWVGMCHIMNCSDNIPTGCINYSIVKCSGEQMYRLDSGEVVVERPTPCVMGAKSKMPLLGHLISPGGAVVHKLPAVNIKFTSNGFIAPWSEDNVVPVDHATKTELGIVHAILVGGEVVVGEWSKLVDSIFSFVSDLFGGLKWVIIIVVGMAILWAFVLITRLADKTKAHDKTIKEQLTPLQVVVDGQFIDLGSRKSPPVGL